MQLIENAITEYVKRSTCYASFLSSPDNRIDCDELSLYPLTRYVKAVSDRRGGRTIVLCATEDEARGLYESLSDTKDTPVIFIPSDGRTLYSEFLEKRVNYTRKKAQEKFMDSKKAIVILSLRSFSSPFLSPQSLKAFSYTLKCGEEIDVDALSSSLAESGYYRAESASEEGAFTLRGEIIDIYPFASEKK